MTLPNGPKMKCLYKKCIIGPLFMSKYRYQPYTVTQFQVAPTLHRPPTFIFSGSCFSVGREQRRVSTYTYTGTDTFTYMTPSMFLHLRWRPLLIDDSLSNKVPLTLSEHKELRKKKKKIPQNNGFIMKGISLTEQIVLENSPNLKGIQDAFHTNDF